MKVGLLASHPIQYLTPLLQELSKVVDLHVYYSHQSTSADQSKAGYGVEFEWDIDLLSGYSYTFLKNSSKNPGVNNFFGCNNKDLSKYIKREGFNAFIVTGWYLRSYWQAIHACHSENIPVLVRGDSHLGTPRSLVKRVVKEVAYRWIIKQFDGFLFVGNKNKEYLLHYGADERRLFSVPHFIDNKRFKEISLACEHEQQDMLTKLSIHKNELILLFVGRLVPFKRPMDLIVAIKRLNDKKIRVRGVFVGSGPLEGELKARSKDLGLDIIFTGFKNQSELPLFYSMADMLVLPSSSHETWGLVANEALACGTPIIVSEAVGCSTDLVDDCATGVTFKLGNTVELTDAILKMIPKLSHKNTSAAIERKCENYSIEKAIKGILEAVEQVGR